MSDEKKRTPPYVGYGTFKNQIMGLDHVPATIDNSVFPKMGGSTRSAFFGSLRFFNLIRDDGSPGEILKGLAGASEADWKAKAKALIQSSYTDDQLNQLGHGTMSSLKKAIGGDEVGSSIVAPACRFLIAAAADVGISVSGTIAKSKVGGSPRAAKKPGNKRSTPRTNGGGDGQHPQPPKGGFAFPVYFKGGRQGQIVVPNDFDQNDLQMLKAALQQLEVLAEQSGVADD